MPEPIRSESHEIGDRDRSAAERSADRAAIADSIADLLPTLIAKLGATELAEIELRERGVRVRLRRPTEASGPRNRRSTDRGDRADRVARGISLAGGPAHPVGLTAVGPGREGLDGRDGREGEARDNGRTMATSPAVGIFQAGVAARAGTRVRAGDRIGTVDMLGVPQEVVAPTDGLVGASLVEPGEAVEYGQGLVVIEFASPAAPATPGPTHPPATAADG